MQNKLKNRWATLSIVGTIFFSTACGSKPLSDAMSLQAGSPQPQPSPAKSIPLVNEQITSTIAEKLQDKCKEMFSGEEMNLKSCGGAATALARELDFNYIRRADGNSAFVFLNERLHTLLSEPKTIEYLNELQRASLDAVYAQQKFNLWDFTLTQSQGNEDRALERLAVLFQDGAQTAAQRKFLLVEQHPMAFVLGQTLELLEMGLNQGKIDVYPKSMTNTRTALYHYYVPRFLARRLIVTGHYRAMAARLPFVFNSVYELHQIQKAQDPNLQGLHKPVTVSSSEDPALRQFVDKWNRFDELYSDLLDHLSAPLKPFAVTGQADNLQDLYLGYAGGLHGSQNGTLISQEEFNAAFSKDPKLFLKK